MGIWVAWVSVRIKKSLKRSARTEGAEAFVVGTHDPEAIAIAIKL